MGVAKTSTIKPTECSDPLSRFDCNCFLIVTGIEENVNSNSPSPRDPRDIPAETWPAARAGAALGKVCIAPKMEAMKQQQL